MHVAWIWQLCVALSSHSLKSDIKRRKVTAYFYHMRRRLKDILNNETNAQSTSVTHGRKTWINVCKIPRFP